MVLLSGSCLAPSAHDDIVMAPLSARCLGVSVEECSEHSRSSARSRTNSLSLAMVEGTEDSVALLKETLDVLHHVLLG